MLTHKCDVIGGRSSLEELFKETDKHGISRSAAWKILGTEPKVDFVEVMMCPGMMGSRGEDVPLSTAHCMIQMIRLLRMVLNCCSTPMCSGFLLGGVSAAANRRGQVATPNHHGYLWLKMS